MMAESDGENRFETLPEGEQEDRIGEGEEGR